MNTRQIWMPFAGLLAASVLISASGRLSPSAPPDARSASVRYHWRNGTVAPPYHYEYDIVLEPGKEARMMMVPGYPKSSGQNTVWTESFAVSPAARAKLLAMMHARGLFSKKWPRVPARERPVGGGTEIVEVRANRRTYATPAFPSTPQQKSDAQAIYAAVNALVPKGARERLMAKQKAYQEAEKARWDTPIQ